MSGLAKKFVVIENTIDEVPSAQSEEPVSVTSNDYPTDDHAAEVNGAAEMDAIREGAIDAEREIEGDLDESVAEEHVAEIIEAVAASAGADDTGQEEDTEPEMGADPEDHAEPGADTEPEIGTEPEAVDAAFSEPGEDLAPADPAQRPEEYRLLEALLFASREPLDEATLAKRLPQGAQLRDALRGLQAEYATRGVNLVRIGRKWSFRTAGDLSWLLTKNVVQNRKLSRAAIETLAIIAYHQPVTRAEVEEIRGVAAAKGTLDVLLETGWIRPRGRRKVPGRPITYGTSDEFLSHFGLEAVEDLPGLDELRGAGLLDGRLPPGFSIPVPSDDDALRDDEEPLEPGDLLDFGLAPPADRVESE